MEYNSKRNIPKLKIAKKMSRKQEHEWQKNININSTTVCMCLYLCVCMYIFSSCIHHCWWCIVSYSMCIYSVYSVFIFMNLLKSTYGLYILMLHIHDAGFIKASDRKKANESSRGIKRGRIWPKQKDEINFFFSLLLLLVA